MKTIKAFLFILPLTLLGTVLYAQYDLPKYDEVLQMKNRQLVVIINQPDEYLVKKYSKKSDDTKIREYLQMYGNYNDHMKEVVSKYWTFNDKEVLFKTWDEFKEMTHDKAEEDKYYLMYSCSLTKREGFDWEFNQAGDQIIGSQTYFKVGLQGESPFSKFNYEYPWLKPSVRDLYFILTIINYEFNYILNHKADIDLKQMVNENAHILCDKTLLITKYNVSHTIIDNIQSVYPYKYELVDDSVKWNALKNHDSRYACVISSWYEDMMTWVVNCEDGSIIAYKKTGLQLSNEYYRKDFFENIADFCKLGGKK